MDKKQPPPYAYRLFFLTRPKPGDPNELLLHRFLCKGGGLLLCAATGLGKSLLALQFMILWAIGRTCFGIVPARPLRSLLIQAENDRGDLAEFRDGVCAGLKLTDEERSRASEKVIVATEDARTGGAFFQEVVEPLLLIHRPDIVWVDPALAFLGGEASAQRDVSFFLRNQLNPLLRKYHCAAVIIHHANKPLTGKEKHNWQGGDFAYLGSGSIEWANWPRAVLSLRQTGRAGVYELRAPKRGKRLGWRTPDGNPTDCRLIAHSTDEASIFWRDPTPEELATAHGKGRTKSYDEADLLMLLPSDGLPTAAWLKAVTEEYGISASTFHRARRELQSQGNIIRTNGNWLPRIEETE